MVVSDNVFTVGQDCDVVEYSQELPQTYDLRNVSGKCYMTPVKMQAATLPDGQPDAGNCIGSCWAFAAVASFESSLLKQGIVSDPDLPEANISVWHMASWNGYNYPVYVFNPDPIPDYNISFGYTESEPVIRGWGGDHRYAMDYLISGRGPVLNHYAPFPLADIQEKKNLTPPEEHLPVSYVLREARVFLRSDHATDDKFRIAVKRALMEYGALASYQFAHPSMYPGQEETCIFNRTSNNYYFNGTQEGPFPVFLNHAVTIAGWDDTRMVEGALEPGAWLIKNSMGTGFGDEGYFWISYCDAIFLKGNDFVVAFVADDHNFSHRYQTHPGALSDISTEPYEISWDYLCERSASSDNDSRACARFVAEEDAYLKSVGFMTLNRNETVIIRIYDDWDGQGNRPAPDRLLLIDSVRIPEQGFHLIDLSRPVLIKEDREFVIEIGFAAREDLSDGIGPLVYVTADKARVGKTYRLTCDQDGREYWEDYANLHNGSVFYVQGLTVAPHKAGSILVSNMLPYISVYMGT